MINRQSWRASDGSEIVCCSSFAGPEFRSFRIDGVMVYRGLSPDDAARELGWAASPVAAPVPETPARTISAAERQRRSEAAAERERRKRTARGRKLNAQNERREKQDAKRAEREAMALGLLRQGMTVSIATESVRAAHHVSISTARRAVVAAKALLKGKDAAHPDRGPKLPTEEARQEFRASVYAGQRSGRGRCSREEAIAEAAARYLGGDNAIRFVVQKLRCSRDAARRLLTAARKARGGEAA